MGEQYEKWDLTNVFANNYLCDLQENFKMLKYYATSLPSTRRLALLKQVVFHSFDGNFHFLRFEIKINFWANLVQKIISVCLRLWWLVPRLIWMCWILWQCPFILKYTFTRNTLFGQISSKISKLLIFYHGVWHS